MRVFLSLASWLFLGAFLVCNVKGQTEYAYAAERVASYLLYKAEVFAGGSNSFTSGCTAFSQKNGPPCNFNEFLQYITLDSKTGNPKGNPQYPEPNLQDRASIERAAQVLAEDLNMVDLNRAPLRSGLMLKDSGGYVKFWEIAVPSYIDNVRGRIGRMSDGADKRSAENIMQNLGHLVGKIVELREAPRLISIEKELDRAFPNIKWHIIKTTLGGATFRVIDFAATIQDGANTRPWSADETRIMKRIDDVNRGAAGDDGQFKDTKSASTHRYVTQVLQGLHTKLAPAKVYPKTCTKMAV